MPELSLFGVQPSDEFIGKRYLLAIAIDKYPEDGNFKPLKFPVRQATALAGLLKNEYGFDDVFEFYDKKAARNDLILDEIDRVGNLLTPNDNLVVFFAGHGTSKKRTLPDGSEKVISSYWVPAEATGENTCNAVDEIIRRLINFSCAQVLIVADCCYAGGITEQSQRESLFASAVGDAPDFYVLTSSSKFEQTPDDSPFFSFFFEVLKKQTLKSFADLESEMRKQLGILITATNPAQQTFKFVLAPPDPARTPFKNACRNLNTPNQRATFEQTPRKQFNIIYLHGTDLCAHKIYVHLYLSLLKKENGLELAGSIPGNITLSQNEAVDIASIWKKLDVAAGITSEVKNNLDANHRFMFLTIKPDFPENQHTALQQRILDFWNELDTIHTSQSGQNAFFFFFILDERGSKGKLDLTVFKRLQSGSFYKTPSIEQLDADKLDAWKDLSTLDFESKNLDLTRFDNLKVNSFSEADFFMVSAIQKICTQCNYDSLASQILFNK